MFTDIEVRAGELVDIYPDLRERGRQSVATTFGWPHTLADVLSKQKLFKFVMEGMEQIGRKTVTVRTFDSEFIGIPTGLNADELNEVLQRKGVNRDAIPKPFSLLSQVSYLPAEHELLKNDVFRIGLETTYDFLDSKADVTLALLRTVCTNRAVVKDSSFKICNRVEIAESNGNEYLTQFSDDILARLTKFLTRTIEVPLSATNLLTAMQIADRIDAGSAMSWIDERLGRILSLYDTRHFRVRVNKSRDLKWGSNSWKETATLPVTDEDNLYMLWNVLTEAETAMENERQITHEAAFANNIAIARILSSRPRAIDVARRWTDN